MAELPKFLEDRTAEVILAEMLNDVPEDLDRSEGSYIYDSTAPAANQFERAAFQVQEMLKRAFASTAFGPYLEERGYEAGIFKREAEFAKGVLKITGAANTSYPTKDKIVAVPSDENDPEIQSYRMESDVQTDAQGVGYVNITAVTAGRAGNVPVGAISIMVDTIEGITSVNNEQPTTGGTDREADDPFRERYFQKKRNPSSSGNKSDYANWALEVPGVGGVVVVPVDEGWGTVGVYLLGDDKLPASDEVVDRVQQHIYPPYRRIEEAGPGWTLSGSVSIEDVVGAIDGKAARIEYQAGGSSIINAINDMDRPGLWTFRPVLKADNNNTPGMVIQFGVYDVDTGAWLNTTSQNNQSAFVQLPTSKVGTVFASENFVRFYWDGKKKIAWKIERPDSMGVEQDTTSIVWVDQAKIISDFSTDTGEGVAPLSAIVYAKRAVSVPVTISVRLVINPAFTEQEVRNNVIASLEAYRRDIAFKPDNDFRYSRATQAIIDAPGVADFEDALINGGVKNVVVGDNEVAVIADVIFT